ncbi:helix-turn-helix transcriptional regulator [Streptomyces roseirectus]|uniref:Helix-turn-helix transcriptional regulator n=1 Tax=Streptomyces roseirectus TaxID=2768066 RepID=A0A7H0IQA3_9ACTN|nr:helix-turn-helix transcriptional regulator [Streptomyces roseirectus]
MPDRTSRWRRRKPDNSQTEPHSPTPDDHEFLQGLHDIRHLLSGEWTWDVLIALHAQPLLFTELRETIRSQDNTTGWPSRKHHHLQDNPLNRTLRRLQQGELITQSRSSVFPYRTTYELTRAARELLSAAAPLVVWTATHADLLDRARQRRKEDASD